MKRLLDKGPALLVLLIMAVAWEWLVVLFEVPHFIIPRLSDVFVAIWDNRALLAKHWVVTWYEAVLGLLFSVVFGVLAALWIESSLLARKAIYPLVVASQTIPIIALSPIMVLWFGYEIWSKLAVVILFTFFPITVNTADGFRSADPDIGDLLRTMGANRWQLFRKWKIPSALPGFFTGLKMGATISVGGATLGEWLGAESGLGMFTRRASNMLRAEDVFAGVLLLSLMGILMFWAARLLERLVLGRFRRAE